MPGSENSTAAWHSKLNVEFLLPGMPDNFLAADKIVENLSIEPGQIIADFGAGHGFFALAFARKVGPQGQIFAIDILREALEAINSRARIGGFFNITTIRADLERENGSTLPEGKCDLVFASNILFQAPNKSAVIREASRILKAEGRFVVIEWHPEAGLGPEKKLRLSEEDLKNLILKEGLKEGDSVDAGSHHYGLTFIKSLTF